MPKKFRISNAGIEGGAGTTIILFWGFVAAWIASSGASAKLTPLAIIVFIAAALMLNIRANVGLNKRRQFIGYLSFLVSICVVDLLLILLCQVVLNCETLWTYGLLAKLHLDPVYLMIYLVPVLLNQII